MSNWGSFDTLRVKSLLFGGLGNHCAGSHDPIPCVDSGDLIQILCCCALANVSNKDFYFLVSS